MIFVKLYCIKLYLFLYFYAINTRTNIFDTLLTLCKCVAADRGRCSVKGPQSDWGTKDKQGSFGVVAFVTIFLAIFVVITAQKYSVKFSND